MANKTIPELNPTTSFNGNALVPIDTGIQSYKITAQNAAISFNRLSSSFSDYDAAKSYGIGDYVKSGGDFYKSLANANVGNAVTDATKWAKNAFEFIQLKNQASIPTTPTGYCRIYSDAGGIPTLKRGTWNDNIATVEAARAMAVPHNITSGRTITTLPASRNYALFAVDSFIGTRVVLASGGAAAGMCATSPDGITWTSRTMPVANYWTLLGAGTTSVLAGIFVAFSYSFGAATVYTSPDGITWTARTIPNATYFYSNLVFGRNIATFANPTWLVCADGGRVYRSVNDGTTWALITNPSTIGLASATGFFAESPFAATPHFLVCGYDTVTSLTKIFKSTDYGSTWSNLSVTGIPANKYISKITHVGGKYIALVTDNVLSGLDPQYRDVYHSPDGLTWTQSTNFLSVIGPDISDNNAAIVYTEWMSSSKYVLDQKTWSAEGWVMIKSQTGLCVSRDGDIWYNTGVYGYRYGVGAIVDATAVNGYLWFRDTKANRMVCLGDFATGQAMYVTNNFPWK